MNQETMKEMLEAVDGHNFLPVFSDDEKECAEAILRCLEGLSIATAQRLLDGCSRVLRAIKIK